MPSASSKTITFRVHNTFYGELEKLATQRGHASVGAFARDLTLDALREDEDPSGPAHPPADGATSPPASESPLASLVRARSSAPAARSPSAADQNGAWPAATLRTRARELLETEFEQERLAWAVESFRSEWRDAHGELMSKLSSLTGNAAGLADALPRQLASMAEGVKELTARLDGLYRFVRSVRWLRDAAVANGSCVAAPTPAVVRRTDRLEDHHLQRLRSLVVEAEVLTPEDAELLVRRIREVQAIAG